MADKSLHEKLIDIQQRLKVPKDQENSFGGFQYRNLEDIEDRLKPFLKEHKLSLIFRDEIVAVGERVYVKATANLSDGENAIKNSAFAREAVTPKAKTDDAQLTGACSSYARKYAASGLFLIDNTKDADSMDNSKTAVKSATTKKADSFSGSTDKPRYITMKQVELLVNKVKWGLSTYDKEYIVSFLDGVIGKDLNKVTQDEMDGVLINVDKAIKSAKVDDMIGEPDKVIDPDNLDEAAIEEAMQNDLAGIPF